MFTRRISVKIVEITDRFLIERISRLKT